MWLVKSRLSTLETAAAEPKQQLDDIEQTIRALIDARKRDSAAHAQALQLEKRVDHLTELIDMFA